MIKTKIMHRITTFLFSLVASGCLFAQPANDNPCGAITLPVNSNCVATAATNTAATSTAGPPAPACGSFFAGLSGDVWYKLTVPANGAVIVTTTAGTLTDAAMSFYTAATCAGPFTAVSCNDDVSIFNSMPALSASGLVAGSTLWIRVWGWVNLTGTFSICAQNATSCGTPATNDYCPNPAQLTQGPGNFSASTDVTFSADTPGNLMSYFCGSVENNSWYQFTASSTTHTFPIISLTGCVNNYGIQAQVYEVTYNAAGCCTGFTSMSNCYNPGNLTLGTVTATGLTVGQQYILMVDGFAGDGCEFTISGWSATGILPVELLSFSGKELENHNELNWVTASEKNADYFDVQYSSDGYHFESVGTVDAIGNSNEEHSYSFNHFGARQGVNYYRLEQVDLNGTRKKTETITVNRTAAANGLVSVFPNPAKTSAALLFYCEKPEQATISVHDAFGRSIYSTQAEVDGTTQYYLNTSDWSEGSYTIITTLKNSVQQQQLNIIR